MKLPTFEEHCKLVDEKIALEKRMKELPDLKGDNKPLTEEEKETIRVAHRFVEVIGTIKRYHQAFKIEFGLLKLKPGTHNSCTCKTDCHNEAVSGISLRYKDSNMPGYRLGAICEQCLAELREKAIEIEPSQDDEEVKPKRRNTSRDMEWNRIKDMTYHELSMEDDAEYNDRWLESEGVY